MKQLDVLYEDNACMVINKPAGLAVQGGKGIGISLDSILTQTAEAGGSRPLLVHRLDRDTSGLVLVAKNKAEAARFSRLLGGNTAPAGRAVIKQYLAVCKGKPAKPEGVIQAELAIHGSVKDSITRYRLLSVEGGGEFSLLELELGTGRMHQIRRHLALTGNPVLGDDKYGDFKLNRQLRKTMQLRHLLLHASRIIIQQTSDRFSLDVSAPLPEYFHKFIDQSYDRLFFS
jgi:23S rRNA pseudouridine955/2504/2580 synthase